jgi:hypothetical protein
MPRRNATLSDKITLFETIKNEPPITSQRRLAKITEMLKSTIARVIQQRQKVPGEWPLRC